MTPVPLELPISATEAVKLAEIVFQFAEGRRLTDDVRGRIGARAKAAGLNSVTAYAGSLAKDLTHTAAYYLAVDGTRTGERQALLLHMALASAPSSALFPKPLLIARMRPTGSPEIVVNAIPFSPNDQEHLRTFSEEVDRAFLPRPQGTTPAISIGGLHPDTSLQEAFGAFRTILKTMAVNLACTSRNAYYEGLWAAIRCGWREGYSAESADIVIGSGTQAEVDRSVDAARYAVEHAIRYTKFTVDASPLFQTEAGERDGEVEERFNRQFDERERSWLAGEFGGLERVGEAAVAFSPAEIRRLAVRYGRALKASEQLYDHLKLVKAGSPLGRAFDFEMSLTAGPRSTTAKELAFVLHWFRSRGRQIQLAAPNLGFIEGEPYSGEPEELRERVAELSAVARSFNSILSIHNGSGKQAEVLNAIGRATSGRVCYRISDEVPPGFDSKGRTGFADYVVWLARNLRS